MIEIKKNKISSLKYYINHNDVPPDEIHIAWLGQAGFTIQYRRNVLLIDPYLSDYLSKKV
jgi:hypothetical protein